MSFRTWMRSQYEEKGPMKWLAFFFELLASVALFGLMAMTCFDVIGRYFFNSPVRGGTELTEMGLAIVVFAALPVVTWRGGQIVVDLIDPYLNVRVLRLLSVLGTVIMTASLFYLGNRIFDIAERALRRGIVTDFLAIPTGYLIQYIAVMSWVTAVGVATYGLYRVCTSKDAGDAS
ncbi:MAG TPA: TRAP transporter small permease [Alcaligenaceae bacterium]|nr:TRAP transporter small permease [Alcaligenaceae bacterium]